MIVFDESPDGAIYDVSKKRVGEASPAEAGDFAIVAQYVQRWLRPSRR